jgi:hypothetical protein
LGSSRISIIRYPSSIRIGCSIGWLRGAHDPFDGDRQRNRNEQQFWGMRYLEHGVHDLELTF